MGDGVFMFADEKVLIRKSKEGDLESFERLIERYQKKVFNIAYKMIGNYDDASELAQEVFLRVFKSIKKFKEESLFSTWIFRITTNVCLDELRKRKNNKVIYLEEDIKCGDGEIKRQVVDDKPTPEMALENNELKKTLKEAINNLSEDYKIVIVMRDIQGFSYKEIAEIIKCPEGTVKSRINRARLMLKDELKFKMELTEEKFVK